MDVTCSTRGRDEERIHSFSRETYRKRLLERPERWCECNIKMGIRYIVFEGMDLIQLAHVIVQWRAIVNTAINLRIS